MRFYIVIPAHNEDKYIKFCLKSIVNQSYKPSKVVIVNDSSTDKTEAIIDEFCSKYDYLYKVNSTSSDKHLPGSKVVNAFYNGFDCLDSNYDVIMKLDADIILPKDYLKILSHKFKSNNLGICGGFIYEKNDVGIWQKKHLMNNDHIRGAFKAYSKNCFKKIGRLKVAMGWDTVDELLAKYHGFQVSTIDCLHVKHLRPTGNNYHKTAKYLQGKSMFSMRYGIILTLIASLKMAKLQGRYTIVINNLIGYLICLVNKEERIVTKEEGFFIKKHRFKNIYKKLRNIT